MAKSTRRPGPGKARNAINGEYVTLAYAARHPKTTVVERPTKRSK